MPLLFLSLHDIIDEFVIDKVDGECNIRIKSSGNNSSNTPIIVYENSEITGIITNTTFTITTSTSTNSNSYSNNSKKD